MGDLRQFDPAESADANQDTDDFDTVLTTPADVESAGRSCMAIVVLAAIILLILLVWLVYRSLGGQ